MHYVKKILNNKRLVENFSYVSALEVCLLITPLITYPYLVRVLGIELYGVIVTAQVLSSYASKIIDFGSNSICAKHVSINRDHPDKLSEILSSVLTIRFILWFLCFIIYFIVVLIIPEYHKYLILFILSYGITLNEVLFPQFFFQGLEEMKYSTIINIVVKLLFVLLIFLLVKNRSLYWMVPILYTVGYAFAGAISLYIIFNKMGIKLIAPSINAMIFYIKDCFAIFATDLICTIKDKFTYLILGALGEASSVVIYDLGLKINALLTKPVQVLSIVLFPRFAKERNISHLKVVLRFSFVVTVLFVILVNIFMTNIVNFFINESIDLLPIRILSISPIFLSISSIISSNLFIAFGKNKFVLYSILITTSIYVLLLMLAMILGEIKSLYVLVIITMITYFVEFIYRIYIATKFMKNS